MQATALAVKLLGDAIGANLFLVGYAWQKGALPLSSESIFKAIDLNGVKPDWNKQAFEWGRLAAHDPAAIESLVSTKPKAPKPDDEFIADRVTDLTKYQNVAYADRYKALVAKVAQVEKDKAKGLSGLTRAVAAYAYKLMAYKDEYEVARLQTDPEFKQKLDEAFDGNYKLKYHLSPPLFALKDKITGRPRKYEIGSWIVPLYKVLAKMKGLRGTAVDVFGYTAERKMERGLIQTYEKTIDELIGSLDHDNHSLAVKIASLPDKIRGYGYIKEESVTATNAEFKDLMAHYRDPTSLKAIA